MSLVLQRYARQNGITELSETESAMVARRLMELIESRGLPRPLRPAEMGEPGEICDEEVAPMVAALLSNLGRPADYAAVVRQLIKACFYPEFRKCRESYHEQESDGSCRRQQLQRVRTRVSGSHCVDCPYWTSLNSTQHAALLTGAWAGDVAVCEANLTIFLPEDFRIFRQLVRARAGSDAIRE